MTLATILASLVTMLVAWPLVRLVSIPSIRREYRRVAWIAGGLVAAWCALVVVVASVAPAVLLACAAIAGVLLAFERWRARSGYGAARGLPPGSLSLVPRGPWVDDRFYATQGAAHGPIFKMSQFFRPTVCVMGPAEGVDLFDEHADDLYSPAVRFSRFIPRGYIRYMPPADHAHYKPLLRNALNSKVLADCSGDFRRFVAESFSRIAQASRTTRGGIHPEPEISRLTFRCMVRLFLGIAGDSEDIERLSFLYRRVEIGKASSRWRAEDRNAANAVAACIAERLERAADLPSCVLREIATALGSDGVDETVLLNLVYIIRVSSSDLAGFLTWAVKLSADNPGWLERLETAIAAGEDDEAAELAVLMLREMLRLERSEFIFRQARRTFRYKGYTIPRNWLVRVCIRDGHRDARTFDHPETFNPLRFRSRTYTKKEYSPLGMGDHACLGGQTINAVGRIFLLELARSWSLSVTADGPREYGRSHWQPGSGFRIALVPSGTERCEAVVDAAALPVPEH